jgi:hypothetical protein
MDEELQNRKAEQEAERKKGLELYKKAVECKRKLEEAIEKLDEYKKYEEACKELAKFSQ